MAAISAGEVKRAKRAPLIRPPNGVALRAMTEKTIKVCPQGSKTVQVPNKKIACLEFWAESRARAVESLIVLRPSQADPGKRHLRMRQLPIQTIQRPNKREKTAEM